jgi:ribosome modulation factor
MKKIIFWIIGLLCVGGCLHIHLRGSQIEAENRAAKQQAYVNSIFESGKLAGRAGASSEANPWQRASSAWHGDKTAEAALWLNGWSQGKMEKDSK